MKPAPFDHVAPDSRQEVLEALARYGWDAKILAGGQSLVPLLNFRLAQPAVLVDVNRLRELDFVEPTADGGLRLGALTRLATLERDERITARAPVLAEAAPWIAHPQIRNRGTVGGSLAHADPAAELPALALALDARFTVARQGHERRVAAGDFYLGLLTTDLAAEELLTEVEIPPSPPGTGWAFLEQARRHGDYAQAGVIVGLTLDEAGVCQRARMVYFSLGDTALEARRAATIVEGQTPSPELFREAAVTAAGEVEPDGDIHASAEFKRHLAEVLTRRALERAAQRARAATGGPGA